MAVKTFSVGETLTAADTNTYLSNAGLVYIKEVALTSGSSRDITSCFSATYISYRLVIMGLQTNGTDSINVQLLSGTTPAATNYDRQRLYAQATTVGSTRTTAQTSLIIGYTATNMTQFFAYDISQPYESQKTRFLGSEAYDDANINIDMTAAMHTTTSSYDGIRILCGGNSFTAGRAIVYGYRQA